MLVKKERIKSCLLLVVLISFAAIVTEIIYINYQAGDLLRYHLAYESIQNKSVLSAFNAYKLIIGSGEFFHFGVSWIFSGLGVPRKVFLFLLNAFLMVSLASAIVRLSGRHWLAILLCLTSFYVLVLLIELERLKLAISFIFLALRYKNNMIYSSALICCAVLTQVQTSLLVATYFFPFLLFHIGRFVGFQRLNRRLLLPGFVVFCIGLLLSPHIIGKINAYGISLHWLDLLKSSAALVLLFWCDRRTKTILYLIPLFGAVLIFGGSRINILIYFWMLYCLLQGGKWSSIFLLLVSTYSLGKALQFFFNYIETGRGFL